MPSLFIELIPLVLPSPTRKEHLLIAWSSRRLRIAIETLCFHRKKGLAHVREMDFCDG